MVSAFDFPEEITLGMSAISNRTASATTEEVNAALSTSGSKDLTRALGAGVVSRVANALASDGNEDELRVLVNRGLSAPYSDSFLEGYLTYSGEGQLRILWDSFSAGHESWPASIRNRYLEQMAKYDPQRALEWIGSNHQSDPSTTGTIFHDWLQRDASAATASLAGSTIKLTPQQMDYARLEISKHAFSFGEHDTAKQWVGQIGDPALRTKGMEMITSEPASKK